MEVTGETCKLCLKYIQGDDLALLDETILGKLEFLQMDLDQSVEESNALCKECEEKIESAFDFKSCLVNTESCLVPYVSEDKTQKVNLRVILEKDTSSSGKGESSVEKEVCRLCKNFVKTNTVISLPKVLKDDTIMEVFQGHIPEMDLDVTENPMVCDSCHNSLASFSTLIASWSIANGWNEDDEDMKEDFEMVNVKNETLDGFSDSKTNSSASFLENSGSGPSNSKNGRIEIPKIKTEIDEISDSTSESVTVPKVIKKEECADEEDAVTTIDQDLQLKSEEVEIKDEDGTTRRMDQRRNGPIPAPLSNKRTKNHLSVDEKLAIINIHKAYQREHPNSKQTETVNFTSSVSGASVSSVYKVLAEYKAHNRVLPPRMYRRPRAILDRVSDATKMCIRRIVHGFFVRNEIPTCDKILTTINNDDALPNFKKSTLLKLLKEMHFRFERRRIVF